MEKMNEIGTAGEEIVQEELFRDVLIRCPKCDAQKKLKIPTKIVHQSRNMMTISIPTGTICEHYFQAFVDKFYNVRGYQMVDFMIRKMEYYESKVSDEEKDDDDLTSQPLFQEIIGWPDYLCFCGSIFEQEHRTFSTAFIFCSYRAVFGVVLICSVCPKYVRCTHS